MATNSALINLKKQLELLKPRINTIKYLHASGSTITVAQAIALQKYNRVMKLLVTCKKKNLFS